MSTPGRKRVQPILIDDDDDSESLISSSTSSNANTQDTNIPSLPPATPESSSLLSADLKQPIKKTLYVALNFDELSHIRNVQSNSEFAALLYDFKLYKNVVNGHICFSCRKVKFSFLQPGTQCAICLQRICSKCQRKMNIRHDNICFVSLNLLRRSSISSTTMTIGRNERADSESSSSSSSTISKSSKLEKRKLANNSFTCCIDCFILFDPSSLV